MATVRDLDTRVDELEKSFLTFREGMSKIVSVARWVGGFAAATLVAIVSQTYYVSYTAGRIEQTVTSHGERIEKLEGAVGALGDRVRQVEVRIERVDAKVDALTELVKEVRADLRQIQADLKRNGPAKP